MGMAMKCLIEADFPDSAAARAARKSLGHEGAAGGRSSAKLHDGGKTLTISIEAQDAVALRAAANAYLRALAIFGDVEKDDAFHKALRGRHMKQERGGRL